MSRKPPLDFETEVQRYFQFLVSTSGMAEPEYGELLLPGVRYQRPDLQVQVVLDAGDGAGTRISVGVSLSHRDWPARARLPDLVEAAVFAPRHLVPWRAHSPEAARVTLEGNATWLGRLLPLLLGPDADALVRAANEHPVDRVGNPKKRRRGIDWTYA
jgi:hypothetical protein